MEPADSDVRRGRRILAWTIVALTVATAALWLLWGFRWPPTV